MLFVSRNWLAIFTALVATYVGTSFAAPVFIALGLQEFGLRIYQLYWPLCHQFAHRSWFLFGQEAFYPAPSFQAITGIDPYSAPGRWAAKDFYGNEALGWKVALCERDVAIYAGILAGGIIYGTLRSRGHRLRSPHWLIYVLVGLAPISIDGFSQLLSQPPYMLPLLPFRESTPVLRILTGSLFGSMNVMLAYPYIEKWMREVENEKGYKLRRRCYTEG